MLFQVEMSNPLPYKPTFCQGWPECYRSVIQMECRLLRPSMLRTPAAMMIAGSFDSIASHICRSTSHFALLTSPGALKTAHLALHTSNFTVHTSHFTLQTALFTPHTSHCTPHTSHSTLHLIWALLTLTQLISSHFISSHMSRKLPWITSQYYD